MTLIKSISGIRGTIGAGVRDGLNPVSIAQFTAAYAQFTREFTGKARPRIVVGRDARMSGDMVRHVVIGTLLGMGCDVIDIGLATTPTTEMAVTGKRCDGGIIITASHNPREWNALKLLNERGEFSSKAQGEEMLRLAESKDLSFAPVESMGRMLEESSYLEEHITEVLRARGVDVEAIREANFKVAFDSVNSVGAIALPPLFKALGVEHVFGLYTDVTGNFAHNPEPLPEHLGDISRMIRDLGVDVGFVVDPDVDRLSILDEQGNFFGEEYTLVAIADYYPELHYGRDALVGIALFLSLLAKKKKTVSELRTAYPQYFMSKQKVELPPRTDTQLVLERLAANVPEHAQISLVDGVKLDFEDKWVHIRRSNTEPIIRIYTEATTQEAAQALADEYKNIILKYFK